MKTKWIRLLPLAFCCTCLSSFGQSADQIAAAKDILAKAPPAELAAKCAQLVAGAPAREKVAVAAAVGHAVAKVSPPGTPAAVTAVAVREPSTAPSVAAAAATELPNSAPAIAVAAIKSPRVSERDVRAAVVAAAPGQSVAIITALVQARGAAR
ncbi:MAG TPA: hypothetical protein VJW76_10510 [Verrucomicrobiae bacterium]|nr:hypothetical protein [Verrucomicrobiae bacterium]